MHRPRQNVFWLPLKGSGMAIDAASLIAAVAAHGRVARVVVADVAGSVPRDPGAAMLIWDGGQSGTIGGGALEFEAARMALKRTGATRHALGPGLGQCCGGAVTLWTEHWDASRLDALKQPMVACGAGRMPPNVNRAIETAKELQIVDGWLVEPVAKAGANLWIWGAGHVGRAIVDVLAPIGAFAVTWVDTAPERFPNTVPAGVSVLPVPNPAKAVPMAPKNAAHLILTYSHDLDLALCHALLCHQFSFSGLIGSETKWARFRSRLRNLGHSDKEISRICCPIGQKSLGKHPQAIAVGVAGQLLTFSNDTRGHGWTTSSLSLTG